MAIISEFYKRLRDLCEERNMTVNELVKVLDLSSGSPTAWKNGTIPRQSTLAKLAEYFDVSINYLSGKEAKKENSPDQLSLTEGEEMLLNLFRQVPADQQELVLQMIRVALGTQK